MRKINLIVLLALSVGITLGSCTKTGPVGPEGAQGEQGPPGPKGEDGPKGDDGQTGNAEMIVSEWVQVAFQKKGDQWLGTIENDAITQKYVDSADLNVFIKMNGNIYALNYFQVDAFYVTQEVKPGAITIHSSFDASTASFRYIFIPAGAPANARKAGNKPADYTTLCTYYHLMP